MKKTFVLGLLFCANMSVSFAQSKSAVPVFTTIKANPITSVKDQNRSGTCWDYATCGFLESEILRKTGKTVDLVLLGDSIMHFWEWKHPKSWARFTNGKTVLNLGYGGDKTENVIWRIEHGELDGYEAKYAVLMIGTNNRGNPAEIARSVKKALNILLKKQPSAKVLLFAIFPRGRTAADVDRRRNAEVNALLKDLVDCPRVVWIDIWDKFLSDDGTLPKVLFPDELHPSSAGYAIWQRAIMQYLEEHP